MLLLKVRISVVDLGHLSIASERLVERVPGRVWRIFFFLSWVRRRDARVLS
jgi:hypothetical protein